MARRRSQNLREWVYTLVGLTGIGIVLVRSDKPNPVVLLILATIAGRPAYEGLDDIIQIGRRNSRKTEDDDVKDDE